MLSTAVIHPLRSHFADTHLTFLVGPRAIDILEADPQLDATIVYDNRGEHSGLKGRLKLLRSLRKVGYDLVVNLRDSILARFISAEHWGLLRGDRNRHAVTRYLEVLNSRGVDIAGSQPCIQITDAEKASVKKFLRIDEFATERLLIGIHPGGNWKYKLWQAEKFAQLADSLHTAYNAAILLFAGPSERNLQAQIAEMMETPPLIIEIDDLRELAALISSCNLYIGNDTGPMHIAAAVGTPVVALFGSTDRIRSGPYGEHHTVVQSGIDLGCNPCHPGRSPGSCGVGTCAVIDAISVEQVIEKVVYLIGLLRN